VSIVCFVWLVLYCAHLCGIMSVHSNNNIIFVPRPSRRGLYAPGQLWLEREDILGKAVGTLRYVGMVTIALNDYPVLKYVLVGMMGLFVLTSKEG